MLIIRRNKSTGGVYYELQPKPQDKSLAGGGLQDERSRLPPVPRVAASGVSMKKWVRDNERLVEAFDDAVDDVVEDIVEEGTFCVTRRDLLRERLRRYLYSHSSSARSRSAPAAATLHDDDAAA